MSVAPWPKRLVTTFTSSGWETRLAICELVVCNLVIEEPLPRGLFKLPNHKLQDHQFLLRSFLVLVQRPVHFFCRQVFMEVVVHLRGRRPAACSDTLDFFQRKQAIRGRSFVSDS